MVRPLNSTSEFADRVFTGRCGVGVVWVDIMSFNWDPQQGTKPISSQHNTAHRAFVPIILKLC